jgi:N-acyl-L-homoserine lactone synthetase
MTIGSRRELTNEIVNSMHDFRYAIFVRRLGWSLPLQAGIERDQYDSDHAVYFVVRDGANNVTACARLLPTTAPYMLADVFPHLLGDHPAPRTAAVWELSRFATSTRKSGEARVLSLSQPTQDLLEAILEFGRQHAIQQLALVTSVSIERLLLRAGFNVHRAAAPAATPDGLIVALFIEVNAAPGGSTQESCSAFCTPSSSIQQ